MLRRGLALTMAMLCGAAIPAAAGDPSAAEAAFLRGRELFRDGRYAEACPAFERSLELDPQFGTRYNLARCYEQQGRLASAWRHYRELAQRDPNAPRRDEASRRARALEPRLTQLLIAVAAPAPGLIVERDGVDVTAGVGFPAPVDAGDHVITARGPGRVPWSTTATATGEGRTITVTVPALERAPRPVEPPPQPPSLVPPVAVAAPVAHPPAGRGRRIAALSLGGAGVIAAGVGLAFGADARSDWARARELCGDDLLCPDARTRDAGNVFVRSARRSGHIATALVGVGATALTAGVILWLTAPSDASERAIRVTPEIGPDRALITAGGSF